LLYGEFLLWAVAPKAQKMAAERDYVPLKGDVQPKIGS